MCPSPRLRLGLFFAVACSAGAATPPPARAGISVRPGTASRGLRTRLQPAALVRKQPATAWCLVGPGAGYLVYPMMGEAVELDLAGETGGSALTWLNGQGNGPVEPTHAVRAGGVVSLTPPPDSPRRPWAAWLTRR